MKTKAALLALCLTAATASAEQMAMGNWRTHLAYSTTQIIAQTPDKVYGVSNGALYSVDKDDNAIELKSKITGLSDNNIAYIAYSNETRTLVVAYANSNIDLLPADGGIYNITDLYRKNMAGSKAINHIYCTGTTAYLSCDFGIVKLDIAKREIADTYIIGESGENTAVLSLAEHDGLWYATTPNAVMTAPTAGVNLANFENWTAIPTPTSKKNKRAVVYNNDLYLLQSDSVLYRRSASDWNKYRSDIIEINADGGWLFIIEPEQFHAITATKRETFAETSVRMAAYDSVNNLIWAATYTTGIARVMPETKIAYHFLPNGPASNYTWRIKYSDGKMYAVPGGRWAGAYSRPGHVMMFENGSWKNIFSWTTNSYINENLTFPTYISTTDFVDIAIDPNDSKHFFVASYGKGLYEFRDNKPYMLYNADNSGVETIYPQSKPDNAYYFYHRLDGLTYDKEGNLWFLNVCSSSETSSLIKYLQPDGAFKSVRYNALKKVSTPQDIVISNQDPNQKWVLIPRTTSSNSTAIFTFYDNGTPDKTSDDLTRLFTSFYDQDGNRYAPTNFRCMAQDHDNRLWVGSSDGICVLNNQTKAFEEGYTCSRIKIPRNDGTNLADYLLDGVQINAIAVDGSNRKWIGTETNGVFLVSEDGLETIHHFTSENSPLLSDNIICIGINEKTGEVFFGTANGLISYQSDATEANETFSNVHAFPNPVREDFTGVITITGLVTDTRVKITDIAGNVVYETISNGGVATWDGNRRGGGRVATGVYLAMCFSPDGKQRETTKILVINR